MPVDPAIMALGIGALTGAGFNLLRAGPMGNSNSKLMRWINPFHGMSNIINPTMLK